MEVRKDMAYKISDECVSCGACVSSCPVDAIQDGAAHYEITDACVECGACSETCPMDAISK